MHKRSLKNYISEIIHINNRSLFPISWLHKQEFCEYQIFLENVRGIKVKPTKAMVEGKQEHEQLYSEFKKEAVPATFQEMIVESKTAQVLSREFHVVDMSHGVYGLIDEVWLTPDEFVVIDDKPDRKTFQSNINQVYGYCLAFKEIANDSRKVVAALRERGTDNIYWSASFNQQAEEQIVAVIEHVHSLLSGNEEFGSTNNRNKCNSCRFNEHCNRAVV